MSQHKLFSREINNPFLSTLVTLAPIAIIAASLPVLIPVHIILRKMNRNGFWYNSALRIKKESFKKREY